MPTRHQIIINFGTKKSALLPMLRNCVRLLVTWLEDLSRHARKPPYLLLIQSHLCQLPPMPPGPKPPKPKPPGPKPPGPKPPGPKPSPNPPPGSTPDSFSGTYLRAYKSTTKG